MCVIGVLLSGSDAASGRTEEGGDFLFILVLLNTELCDAI